MTLGLWAPGIFSAVLMARVVSVAYRHIIIPAWRERLISKVDASLV